MSLSKAKQVFSKIRAFLQEVRVRALAAESNRTYVNRILLFTCCVMILFAVTVFLADKSGSSRFGEVRDKLTELRELSAKYEGALTKAQITLEIDHKQLNALYKEIENLNRDIEEYSFNIGDPKADASLRELMDMLKKRLAVRAEIGEIYANLYRAYHDYLTVAQKAEQVLLDNMTGQLKVKSVMLALENVRILGENRNRQETVDKIRMLKNDLRDQSPLVQENVGLFAERALQIVEILRYLDTVRVSMRSDGMDALIDKTEQTLTKAARRDAISFRIKSGLLAILSLIIIGMQSLIMAWYFIGRKKADAIRAKAEEDLQFSKSVIARSRLYVAEAQRTQFKILHHFCGDLSRIFSAVKKFSADAFSSNDQSGQEHKNMTVTLIGALRAMDEWVENYLEIHSAREEWRQPVAEPFTPFEILEETVFTARFFVKDSVDEITVYGEDIANQMLGDKKYISDLFKNLLFLTIKSASGSVIRVSYALVTQKDGEEEKDFFQIQISDRDNEENFYEREKSFTSAFIKIDNPEDALQEEKQNQGQHENDQNRFVSSAIFYAANLIEQLGGTIDFIRTPADENVLTALIRVETKSENKKVIGVPLLQNKNVIFVSSAPNVFDTIRTQLQYYGMNVFAVTDRYSAIGQVIGGGEGQEPDIILIDHNPPELDAGALAKVIRANIRSGLFNTIILSSEEDYADLGESETFFDEVILKPALPSKLKARLEHYIDLQLYGHPEPDDTDPYENENVKRILTVMNENLSRMLVQMILTGYDYAVDIAETGEQFAEALQRKNYDYILISETGLKLSAETLCREIRRHPSENQSAVVVVLCDEIKEVIKKNLTKAGCDDFIFLPMTKPSVLEKLEEWAEPITRRTNGPPALQEEIAEEKEEQAVLGDDEEGDDPSEEKMLG